MSRHHQGDRVDFSLSPKAEDYLARLTDFMATHVQPAEEVYHRQRAESIAAGRPNELPPRNEARILFDK